MIKKLTPSRILAILLSASFVLVALHLTFQYLNLALDEKHGLVFEVSNRFDMDDEQSIPTWFVQVILFLISLSALFTAILSQNTRIKRIWYVLSIGGLAGSVNEIAGVHELVLQNLHVSVYGLSTPTLTQNAWLLIIPPVALACGLFFREFSKFIPRRTYIFTVFGAILYFSGTIGVEIASNGALKSTFLYQGILVALEETLELIGSCVILYAIIDNLYVNHFEKLKKLWKVVIN